MSEKMSKQVEAQIADLNIRLEESARTIAEINSSKGRLQNENIDVSRQLEDAESKLNAVTKERASLLAQLDDAKRALEDEIRVCIRSCGQHQYMYNYINSISYELNNAEW